MESRSSKFSTQEILADIYIEWFEFPLHNLKLWCSQAYISYNFPLNIPFFTFIYKLKHFASYLSSPILGIDGLHWNDWHSISRIRRLTLMYRFSLELSRIYGFVMATLLLNIWLHLWLRRYLFQIMNPGV